jgi:TRAP-type C4-dicarboxylate transport system substrate-binding protein
MIRTALISSAALCTAAGILGAAAASAEEVLKMTTLSAPNFSMNVDVLNPWAERVNEQAKGLIKIDVRHGSAIATHANFYQRLVDDVIQISFGVTSTVSGKFDRTNVVSLPFLADKSEPAGIALWRLYKTGMLDSEFDEVKPLMLGVFPQTGLQMREPLKTLDNLNGLKIIAVGKTLAEVTTALGGAPISFRIFELYEAIQRGTVAGAMINFSSFESYKLAEVTHYHVDTRLGTTPILFVMSAKRYKGLAADARKVIEANATEKDTRVFGAYWDRGQEYGRSLVKGKPGHELVTLPPDVAEKWRQRMRHIEDAWVKATPNGAAVLGKYKALLAEVRAGS